MSKIHIFYENKKFSRQIEYIFKTIFSVLKLDFKFINDVENCNNDNNIIIYYGNNKLLRSDHLIIIREGILFSDLYMKEESLPKTPLKKYGSLSVIYSYLEDNIYVKHLNNVICTNMDIIQSCFFMLTRYEETLLWDKTEKDLDDRFPSKEALAVREGFINLPIVNEYIELLWRWIDDYKLGYTRKALWGKHDFAACLTHDVDIPFKYNYNMKSDLVDLKSRKTIAGFKEIFSHTLSNIDYKNDPYYTFNYIRSIEKKYDFKSSFYFMTGGVTKNDNFYKIHDKRIIKLINELDTDGCEIGLHYSYNASESYELLKEEKSSLDKYVINKKYGGRNHFLKYNPPYSWRYLEQLGFVYDTTLGYSHIDGFSCGICTPYKLFDILENRELDIWEIPLTIMDGNLKQTFSMNLNYIDAMDEIKTKIDIVKKYKGIFTLLWHNSSLNKQYWENWYKTFEFAMEYLGTNNALGTSGINIINKFIE